MSARRAAHPAPESHLLPLELYPLSLRPAVFLGVSLIILVITLRLTGRGGMQDMVKIIVPLRGEADGTRVAVAFEMMAFVLLVLENQVDQPVGYALTHALRQLIEQMSRTVIHDRVHRIQAQPVEMKFPQPIQCGVGEKPAHGLTLGAIEIDSCVFWCLV